MMMAQSIIRGDYPCIFQPLSSDTVVSSVSPLLLRYTPQCYGVWQGRRILIKLRRGKTVQRETFNPLPLLIADEIGGVAAGRGGWKDGI